MIDFYNKTLNGPYKVYVNDKRKSKNSMNFQKSFKLYKSLTKMYINLY